MIWDNLNTHISTRMRAFLDAHTDWLTVIRLPGYASELNTGEGIWSLTKRSTGNALITDVDELARTVKNRLKHLQYRPDLLAGCLAQTGLTLDLPP